MGCIKWLMHKFKLIGISVVIWLAGCVNDSNKEVTAQLCQIHGESMLPTLPSQGWAVYTTDPYDTLKVGDIVVFRTKEYGLVNHRIVKSNWDGSFKTRGDNNLIDDPWLLTRHTYVGKLVGHN